MAEGKASEARSDTGNQSIASDVLAGLVTGIVLVFVLISLAALIFSGTLREFYGQGIGVMLLGALLSMIINNSLSHFAPVISVPQDVPATLLALLATGMVSATAAVSFEDFATVVIAMGLTTVLTGGLMWCCGHFNLGRFMRFLPYPVIGGFMAGTGWLLFIGGLSVINDGAIDRGLLAPDTIAQWLPALVFALALLISSRQLKNPLVMPFIFAGTVGAFVLFVAVTQSGITSGLQHAMSHGWLLGPLPDTDLWRPVTLDALGEADWRQMIPSLTTIIAVMAISTISLLLNVSGLEIIYKKDVDLNHELKTVGLSNLAGGMIGSSPGYHHLSLSTLNINLGAKTRLAGLTIILVIATTMIFGASLLAYIPRFVAAGFLLYLGLCFLTEWVIDGWYNLPKTDYVLVCLIVAMIASVGLLQGVVLGVLIAVILFVVAYTNTDVIRHTFSRNKYQSHIMRAPEVEKNLAQQGESVYVIELQGFIFFGMAYQILDKVKARIDRHSKHSTKTILLDFRLVTGLDTSASYSFSRLRQITSKSNITLVFSNVSDNIKAQLTDSSNSENTLFFDDLDQGIAWLDEQALSSYNSGEQVTQPITTLRYFQNALTPEDNATTVADRLKRYMNFASQPPGAVLLQEGEPVNTLFFIERGRVNIQTRLPDGTTKTLRVQNSGTVFGEIGIYTNSTATASVVVYETAEIYSLSQDGLMKMEVEDPPLAIAVHRLIASVLGRKLTQANFALVALQK